jgi:hypothetical protein
MVPTKDNSELIIGIFFFVLLIHATHKTKQNKTKQQQQQQQQQQQKTVINIVMIIKENKFNFYAHGCRKKILKNVKVVG